LRQQKYSFLFVSWQYECLCGLIGALPPHKLPFAHIRKHAMALTLRQTEIVTLARSTGRVQVEDLAQRFEVAVQTIRRDLGDLADSGYLDRVHGGAVPRQGVVNIAYEQRRQLADSAKTAIARACAAAIPDNASLILNLGTTTEAVARALLNHRNITVVTNNMNVANILLANPGCEIMVAGGALRRSDGGLVGDLTTQFFGQFKVDYAVIGASAIDMDGDLLDYDLAEVRVSRAILAQSRRAFLVADHSKLARSAPARIGSLSEIDRFFTDLPLPDPLAKACAHWGTKLVLCGADD
jgi:DeoR family transcriptional regulator, glycerol-3-phosphate regulon repressor